MREPRQERFEGKAGFEAREARAEARVAAAAEGETLARVARDVEPIRVREDAFVALRGADAEEHERTRAQHRTARELDVLARHAVEELPGVIEAEHLFDRILEPRAVALLEPGELCRVIDQRLHAEIDQVRRRLRARHEQHLTQREQLVAREAIALLFRGQ